MKFRAKRRGCLRLGFQRLDLFNLEIKAWGMSCHKIMNRIDKVNRNLLCVFTKLQNVRIRHTLWNLNEYNFIY